MAVVRQDINNKSAMKPRFLQIVLGAALAFAPGTGKLTAATSETLQTELRQNYASIVLAAYSDALAATKQLQETVDAFAKKPSEKGLKACREAWTKARQPYSVTEAFRFYGGPVDGADGLEGMMNSWPVDETWMEDPTANGQRGIIQNTTSYPAISAELLRKLNQAEGEKNICTGWHAMEFLLWGVDHSATGPGDRPWTDFAEGPFASRRCETLKATANILVACLEELVTAWDPAPSEPKNYRAQFMETPPLETTTRILIGATLLAGAEMADERITVALESRDQENEQSCFSDTTAQDVWYNLQGIKTVWEGKFKSICVAEGDVSGTGLRDVAKSVDPTMTEALDKAIAQAEIKAKAMPQPFDQAIGAPDDSPQRKGVVELRNALEYINAMFTVMAGRMSVILPTAPLDG